MSTVVLNPDNEKSKKYIKSSIIYKALKQLTDRLDAKSIEYETKISLNEDFFGHAWIKIKYYGTLTKYIYLCSHSDNVDPECCEGIYRFITVYHYCSPDDIKDFDTIPIYRYEPIPDTVEEFDENASADRYFDNVIYVLQDQGAEVLYKKNSETNKLEKSCISNYPSTFKPVVGGGIPGTTYESLKDWPTITDNGEYISYNKATYPKENQITEAGVTYFGKIVNKKLKYYMVDDKPAYEPITGGGSKYNYVNNTNVKTVILSRANSSSTAICPKCLGKGWIGEDVCSCCHRTSSVWTSVKAENKWLDFDEYNYLTETKGTYHGEEYYDYIWPNINMSNERGFPNEKSHVYYKELGNSDKNIDVRGATNPIIIKNKVLLPNGTYDHGIWVELGDISEEWTNGSKQGLPVYDAIIHYHVFIGDHDEIIKNESVENAKKWYVCERQVKVKNVIVQYRTVIPNIIIGPHGMPIIDGWTPILIITLSNERNRPYTDADEELDKTRTSYKIKDTYNWVPLNDSFIIDNSQIDIKLVIPAQQLLSSSSDDYKIIDGKIYSPTCFGTVRAVGYSLDNTITSNVKLDNVDEDDVSFKVSTYPKMFDVLTTSDTAATKNSKLYDHAFAKTFDYPWDFDSIINFVLTKDHNIEPVGIPDTIMYSISEEPIDKNTKYHYVTDRNFAMSPCEIDNDFNKLGRFLNANVDAKQELPFTHYLDKFNRIDSLYNYDSHLQNHLVDYRSNYWYWHYKGLDRTNAFGDYETIFNDHDTYIWCQTNTPELDDNNDYKWLQRDYTGNIDTVELHENLEDKYLSFEHYRPLKSIYYKLDYEFENQLNPIRAGSAMFYDLTKNGYRCPGAANGQISTDVVSYNTTTTYKNDYGWATSYKHIQVKPDLFRDICTTCSGMGSPDITMYRPWNQGSGTDMGIYYTHNSIYTPQPVNRTVDLYVSPYQYTGSSLPASYSYRFNSKNELMRCPTCRGCGVAVKYLFYDYDLILPLSLSADSAVMEFKDKILLYEKHDEIWDYWIKGEANDVPAWIEKTKEYVDKSKKTVFKTVASKEALFSLKNFSKDCIYKIRQNIGNIYDFYAWAPGYNWAPIYFDDSALDELDNNILKVNAFDKDEITADGHIHEHNSYLNDASFNENGETPEEFHGTYYDTDGHMNKHVLSALYEYCPKCGGEGCDSCNNGFVTNTYNEDYTIALCTFCHGTGKYLYKSSGTDHEIGDERPCPMCNGKKLVADFGDKTSMINPDREVSDKKIYKYTIRQKLKSLDNISVEVAR